MLIFLKLGGSLITEKSRAHTPRQDVLRRLAEEIASAVAAQPDLHLVIGHGSGSFGHIPARRYHTRQGLRAAPEGQSAHWWTGFAEVWKEARALNQIAIDAFTNAGLPVIAFPPSAAIRTQSGQVAHWDLSPLRAALDARLIPVVNGDVVFDETLGGTILSTEEVFAYLAPILQPSRILLAGLDEGVYADFPNNQRLFEKITPETYPQIIKNLEGSAAVDVTGGMIAKVREMLAIIPLVPGLEALIFSGMVPGLLTQTLLGASPGTRICQ